MVSTRAKRSSAQARQTVESCPPENSTRAASGLEGVIGGICAASIPPRPAGPVDDPPARMREGGNLVHLGGRQREVENAEVLRQPLDFRGARNGDDILLRKPAQRDLGRAPAV